MHLTTRVTLAKSVALALVLWLVLLLETGNAASVPSGMRGTGLAGAPAGLVAAIDRSAQREAALDPAFRVDAQGCARLSAQHMTACFTPGGARFRTPRVALQLSLSAWGRPGRLTALALAPGRPHANRIEYRGSGIRAWWRVLPLGYEQGFTVERAPAGRGPVIIELRASRAPAIAGDSLAWGRLHYGQLVVTDARGRVLPATLTAVGRKLVLRFDAARARYPLNVDPLVWVEQEVTARDGAVGDNFGYSVAVSGSTALVGAPYHQVGSNANQGVAYVYTEANGVWSQMAELTASDGAGDDLFGYSVAFNGPTALVGALNHQVFSNSGQGTAYFFGSADLGLVLSTPVTVAPGADYTSQAILTNSSSTASPALSLLLPVPTGTNYVSSSATQGSCSQTAGSVACNLGSLAASGGRANASVTLQTTAAAGTALANNARLALSTPALSQTTTTTVAVTPAVTGLANASVTVGQSVPAASFTISGTGALTVTASSSNTTLLPNAGLSVSSGCNANGAQCTLSMTPAAGQTGTATVTVTAKDTYGQQGVGSFTLTVNSLPPSSSGGGGALGLWSLLGLLLALLLPIIRRRFRPGSNPAPGS